MVESLRTPAWSCPTFKRYLWLRVCRGQALCAWRGNRPKWVWWSLQTWESVNVLWIHSWLTIMNPDPIGLNPTLIGNPIGSDRDTQTLVTLLIIYAQTLTKKETLVIHIRTLTKKSKDSYNIKWLCRGLLCCCNKATKMMLCWWQLFGDRS